MKCYTGNSDRRLEGKRELRRPRLNREDNIVACRSVATATTAKKVTMQ
jgi:hypothetical protein